MARAQGSGVEAGSGLAVIDLVIQLQESNIGSLFSVKGTNVVCRYMLTMRAWLAVECGYCEEMPFTEIPVIIFSPTLLPPPLPPPPADWNPQTMGNVQMEYNQDYNNPSAPIDDQFFQEED